MFKPIINQGIYNYGNYVFKKSSTIINSSDYLQNKKANLLLKNLDMESKKNDNQSEYLFFEKAKFFKIQEKNNYIKPNDITSGLYTYVHLGNSLIFNEKEKQPTISKHIDIKNIYPNNQDVPFYYKYKIDPDGSVFGHTPSQENNYNKYRFINTK